MENKMKVEIWSDIMCPFCYIGKRRFENALKQFPDAVHLDVEWKSYQLSPEIKTDPTINIHQFLAKHKGISVQEAERMNNYVTEMAAGVGLSYHFDTAIPANTFNAHRFIHFAKTQAKQGEAKERLLKAYFTEGKNVDDYATLIALGEEIGLDAKAVAEVLENGTYADEVRADIQEGQQLGLRGVPFFVLDRKYGISGAQEEAAFLQTIEKSFAEWRKNNPEPNLEIVEGKACSTDGECD